MDCYNILAKTDVEIGDKVKYRGEVWEIYDIGLIIYARTKHGEWSFRLLKDGRTHWVQRRSFEYPVREEH